MRLRFSPWLGLLSLSLLLVSCHQNWEDYFNPDGIADHVYRGPVVQMGDGSVRTVFTVSPTGVPLKLGIEMTDGALKNLPTDPMDFEHSMYMLALPQKAKDLTAFDHAVVNWNVLGHEPEHVYDVPHFDFHFYKISVAKQTGIPPYTPETAPAFDNLPPDGYMPESYVTGPGGVPGMGKHWVSTKADELNGKPFTKTFIFGSYDGATTFYEPMITLDLLKSGTPSSTDIEQPKYVSPDETYYPTKYEIARNEKKHTHTVWLTHFVWKKMLK